MLAQDIAWRHQAAVVTFAPRQVLEVLLGY